MTLAAAIAIVELDLESGEFHACIIELCDGFGDHFGLLRCCWCRHCYGFRADLVLAGVEADVSRCCRFGGERLILCSVIAVTTSQLSRSESPDCDDQDECGNPRRPANGLWSMGWLDWRRCSRSPFPSAWRGSRREERCSRVFSARGHGCAFSPRRTFISK